MDIVDQVDSSPRDVLFVQLPHETITAYSRACGASAWLVYCVLLTYRRHRTNVAFPSLSTLSETTGLAISTVKLSIARLTGGDGVLQGNGLEPLLTKGEHQHNGKGRKSGGRPSSEYSFPRYAKDADQLQSQAQRKRNK